MPEVSTSAVGELLTPCPLSPSTSASRLILSSVASPEEASPTLWPAQGPPTFPIILCKVEEAGVCVGVEGCAEVLGPWSRIPNPGQPEVCIEGGRKDSGKPILQAWGSLVGGLPLLTD